MRAVKVHFIGIGGTGMGALAGLLVQAGHEVRGSDQELYPPMSTQLADAKIPVFMGFDANNLGWSPDRIVVGNVCGRDHAEVRGARERGIELSSFPSMLAEALLAERDPLVVAGTHGKTTTASLVAWLLRGAGLDPSFLIGGVPQNLRRGYHLGTGRAFVVEGDEYDTAFFDKKSKFLHYRPKRAILTGIEFDHADMFNGIEDVRGAFREFVETIPKEGDLIVNLDDPEAMGVAAGADCNVVTYRVLLAPDEDVSSADYCLTVRSHGVPRRTKFEVSERGNSLGEFSTQLVGRYNLGNLLAAIAMARCEGAGTDALRESVRRFRGVRRRQETLGIARGVRVIDDFAHHPTAVSLTVTALRKRYPDKSLHICFEPRSATSRRRVFLGPYAAAFDAATSVSVGPLFRPEKVAETDRLDPEELVEAIRARGVEAHTYDGPDRIRAALVDRVVPGDTVAVLSCGSFGNLGRRLLFDLGDPVTFGTDAEQEAVNGLLAGYGLPQIARTETVESLVLNSRNRLTGCVSVDVQGSCAFLFGLAVSPERRGEGLGWVLADCVMRHARTLGAQRVYLMAATAADLFASKLGFRQIDASEVNSAIADTPNFQAASKLTGAVCMVFDLPPEGPLPAPS